MSVSDDGLTWSGGAGWRKHDPRTIPAAFKSIGDLLAWFEITGPSVGWLGTPYSLNGVSIETAVCVNVSDPVASWERWFLYMAPSKTSLAWCYLMNWLKIHPGVKNCPVTTSSQAAQYVAISNQGKFDIKYGDDWGIACHPDMSKLTQL